MTTKEGSEIKNLKERLDTVENHCVALQMSLKEAVKHIKALEARAVINGSNYLIEKWEDGSFLGNLRQDPDDWKY